MPEGVSGVSPTQPVSLERFLLSSHVLHVSDIFHAASVSISEGPCHRRKQLLSAGTCQGQEPSSLLPPPHFLSRTHPITPL